MLRNAVLVSRFCGAQSEYMWIGCHALTADLSQMPQCIVRMRLQPRLGKTHGYLCHEWLISRLTKLCRSHMPPSSVEAICNSNQNDFAVKVQKFALPDNVTTCRASVSTVS